MEFLEVPLFDDDIFKLLFRFMINVFFLSIIVKFAVYPNQRERDFAFTAVMMNMTVFFICFALKKLDLGIGMALGLFAIFGVLRYRTDAIRVKEMTYLFIVIGIAVINSLSNKSTSYTEVVAVNLLIFGAALLKERIVGKAEPLAFKSKKKIVGPSKDTSASSLEASASGTTTSDPIKDTPGPIKDTPGLRKKMAGRRKEEKFTVQYDNLALLGSSHRQDLLVDLCKRTGINIGRVQIKSIDLGNGSATLTIWCDSPDTTKKEQV